MKFGLMMTAAMAAKTVTISAAPLEDGGFEVVVTNDGAPFDINAVPGVESGHYGLAGMRERADRSNLRRTIDGKERKVTICCSGR